MAHTYTRLTPSKFLWLALATALTCIIVLSALRDDRYLRFKSLTEPEVIKAGWIYERIHFDPTPIDVVFIGTSRTVAGIDSAIVEQTCRNAGGKYCSSVNFALLNLGRNIHWLLAREVIQARNPRLLVVEVQETEFRALHPLFPYLADPVDIVSAPLVINTSYLPDLGRLPARQISLFAENLALSLFGAEMKFVPSHYRGPHWDDTSKFQSNVVSVAELERERTHLASVGAGKLRLPTPLRQFEYRANIFYLKKLLNLAREKNISICFLYIPTFNRTSTPVFANLYDKFGPTWQVSEEIANRHELWRDVDHLNYDGAVALSKSVGLRIAQGYLAPDASMSVLTTR